MNVEFFNRAQSIENTHLFQEVFKSTTLLLIRAKVSIFKGTRFYTRSD